MVDVLLGLQYGDEGKGKIVDSIAEKYDIVARFAGGCNAGHTLVFNGQKHVLHLIPSGIFHDCMNVIGNGCVIDPVNLMGEIKELEEMGIDVKSKLYISDKAHITLPIHKHLDKQLEDAKGDKKIGSTLKGIGPTYTSKIGRDGYRMSDFIGASAEVIEEIVRKGIAPSFSLAENKEIYDYIASILALVNYNVINTEKYLNQALKDGKNILAEGAQGTLLDIDFGTYPYVTSSNTCIGGVITGLGVPPQSIKNVIGITKAYCTRVGSGPFITEETGDVGEKIRTAGNEFGSTTGRPRRCGWLDLVELEYSCMINGVTELNIMKLDVLDNMDLIKVCFAHKDDKPIYGMYPGWNEDTSKIKEYEKLPVNCRNFLNFVQSIIKVKISKISVGSDRKETILCE